ncbi:hypothetical protein LXL04_002563 [Taraxacum kok-saghyz]
MVNSTRSIVVALISFMLMAVFEVNRAQELAPSPAPTLPSNDGAAIDQGIAYFLLLVALAITYLIFGYGSKAKGWGRRLGQKMLFDAL